MPLPGLVAAAPTVGGALRVSLPGPVPAASGALVRARDDEGNDDAVEIRRPHEDALCLDFADGARFRVDVGAGTIDGTWAAPLHLDDALVYLAGPVLGAAARLQRRSVLHASAVEVAGHAVLLMGEAGAGKSTLTAALVDAGCPLLAEDVSALDVGAERAPAAYRGGSRVKLWPESVAGLRGHAEALPLLVPSSVDWHKRFLDGSNRMCSAETLPLAGILHLERSAAATTPQTDEVRAHDKLLLLLANGYGARLVRPDDRADELARVTRVAQQVPVLRLRYPDALEALPEVAAAVVRLARQWAAAPGGGARG